MKKNIIHLGCTLVVFALMVLPASATFTRQTQVTSFMPFFDDYDPLDDNITVTVTIKEIRALDTIDLISNPDFYVKVFINSQAFVSDVWQNTKYVETPNFSASAIVPKDTEFVNVTIELWDKSPGLDLLCDISPDGDGTYAQCRTAELTYSIATGIWWGDDSKGEGMFGGSDISGYGRLNGCDDNSIYQEDRDCELWFDITQNDYDGDGLPYWVEVNEYNTSPIIDNRGEDLDNDGLPIEYEHHWGCAYRVSHHGGGGYYWTYDPMTWENHSALDPDDDGLTNIEEYLTSQWNSDPFCQDIFIELDQMVLGPNGEGSFIPEESFDMLRDSYAKHNIVWHIDDGRWGGGERTIPFRAVLNDNDLDEWYWEYFMHQDEHNWRRGVFRWCIVAYNGTWANGFTFSSNINGTFALDCFLISTIFHDMRSKVFLVIDGLYRRTFNRVLNRAYVYAGVIMHETGHTLGIRAPGVDLSDSVWPWQVNYWRYGRYKSVMNYRYVYNGNIDYSDGSHGKNDYDDWGTIDVALFSSGGHW